MISEMCISKCLPYAMQPARGALGHSGDTLITADIQKST